MIGLRILGMLVALAVANFARAGTEFLQHPRWQSYVTLLNFYHRYSPHVYAPLELLPLHKIPSRALAQEILQSTQEWADFEGKKKGTLADRQKQIQMSRAANERLVALLGPRARDSTALQAVVDSIPREARLAMTPLDPLFWNSVIGLKARSDLQKLQRPLNAVQEVRIRSDKGILDYYFVTDAAAGADRYRIKILAKGQNTLRIKGEFSAQRSPRASADATLMDQDSELKVYDLKGAFYQKATDLLPFGAYPAQQDVFLSEDGKSHFKGDGHKHFF